MRNEFGSFAPGKRPGEWFRHDSELGPTVFREADKSLLVIRTKQVIRLAEKQAAIQVEKDAYEARHKERHAQAMAALVDTLKLLKGRQIGRVSITEAKGTLWDKRRSGDFELELEPEGLAGSQAPLTIWSEGHLEDYRISRRGWSYIIEVEARKAEKLDPQVIADIILTDIGTKRQWGYKSSEIHRDANGYYRKETWENAHGEAQQRRAHVDVDDCAPHTKYDGNAGTGAW